MLGDVDVIGFCVPATEKVGPGDRRIAESLDGYRRAKKVAIVTKTDAATREQITERLLEVDALREDWAAVIPLSALTNEQLDVLTDELLALMPEGPPSTPTASSPTSPSTTASPRSSARRRWRACATSCRTRSP